MDLPFNLTVDDIHIPKRCPVLGIVLNMNRHEEKPSLDRIIPSLGYVHGNVIVISVRANRLKADASLKEMSRITSFYTKLLKGKRKFAHC